MFNFIKNALKKVYTQFASNIQALFLRSSIDEDAIKELETILIASDAGVKPTRRILTAVREQVNNGSLKAGAGLKELLRKELLELLSVKPFESQATVYLLIGINGSGKTTFAGKFAHHLSAQEHQKTLLVAGDTFRAAAVEQLNIWSERAGVSLVHGVSNQDPASVVFMGCERFKRDGFNKLIIDTAGRLQTKVNLMHELAKIKRSIQKQLPDSKICTLLTIDAILGQNSFEQARMFHACVPVDGIVLTKMDGTGKGGVVFNIVQELGVPVAFISCGEGMDQLKPFNAAEYVDGLLQ